MNHFRNLSRPATRRLNRPLGRRLARSCLRRVIPRRPGPDELSQALTAFRRAIRCHHRLAKLAPRFFDSAVVDREALHRAERRQWMALWEPYLNRAYGHDPDTKSDPPLEDLPPLPSLSIQRAVEQEWAGWQSWMAAGRLAMENYHQRHPHALPSFNQIARLLHLATEFGRLACGVDPTSPAPPVSPNYDQVWADLERSYPPSRDPDPPAPATAPVVVPPSATPPPPGGPPPADEKRDLVPYALVRGAHGLLCLQRITSPDAPGRGGPRYGAS